MNSELYVKINNLYNYKDGIYNENAELQCDSSVVNLNQFYNYLLSEKRLSFTYNCIIYRITLQDDKSALVEKDSDYQLKQHVFDRQKPRSPYMSLGTISFSSPEEFVFQITETINNAVSIK